MGDINDNIRDNIRKGLDITKVTNYRLRWSVFSPNINTADILQKDRNNNAVNTKRSSSEIDTFLPPNKRACLISSIKTDNDELSNWKYQHIIFYNYKEPIYKTSSRISLLAALEDYIEGYESLYIIGLFYKDISINNLIVNKNDDNLSLFLFLIDFDFVVQI